MNWLTDFVKPKLSSLVSRKDAPSDLWTNCNKCNLMLYKSEHKDNLFVCSHCDNHMNMDVENRLNILQLVQSSEGESFLVTNELSLGLTKSVNQFIFKF